jgi:CRP/FNR family transcriptional regulator
MAATRRSQDLGTAFAAAPATVRQALERVGRPVAIDEGSTVFRPGEMPSDLLILVEGTLRVQQVSEGGREVVLYRVRPGETCVLTTACLMTEEGYAAEGIAETPLLLAAVPRAAFDGLMAGSAEFRRFVMETYARRLADLFLVVEQIAFRRIDVRLARRLLDRRDAAGRVRATHQQLAVELGTAREVISRQLGEFARRGWVSLARGVVAVEAPGSLEALSRTG